MNNKTLKEHYSNDSHNDTQNVNENRDNHANHQDNNHQDLNANTHKDNDFIDKEEQLRKDKKKKILLNIKAATNTSLILMFNIDLTLKLGRFLHNSDALRTSFFLLYNINFQTDLYMKMKFTYNY